MGAEANNKIRNARQEVASWLVMLGMACFGAVALFGVIHGIWISEDRWIVHIAKEHFAAIVGLPSAAIASLFVVSIFEITAGPIRFDGLGFKFEGASGPIILWVICFLSIAGAIKWIW